MRQKRLQYSVSGHPLINLEIKLNNPEQLLIKLFKKVRQAYSFKLVSHYQLKVNFLLPASGGIFC